MASASGSRIVAHPLAQDHVRRGLAGERLQRVPVAVADLGRPWDTVDIHQLVAGADDDDRGPRHDPHPPRADRGQRAAEQAVHRIADPRDHGASPNVLAARRDVLAATDGAAHLHRVAAELAALLDHLYRVCTLGHRRAGHDGHRAAWLERLRPLHARGHLAHDAQLRAGAGAVGRSHGVPVHGGAVEGRLVAVGHHLGRQHAPHRLDQRDLVDALRRALRPHRHGLLDQLTRPRERDVRQHQLPSSSAPARRASTSCLSARPRASSTG
jgi:hypothetical protein